MVRRFDIDNPTIFFEKETYLATLAFILALLSIFSAFALSGLLLFAIWGDRVDLHINPLGIITCYLVSGLIVLLSIRITKTIYEMGSKGVSLNQHSWAVKVSQKAGLDEPLKSMCKRELVPYIKTAYKLGLL